LPEQLAARHFQEFVLSFTPVGLARQGVVDTFGGTLLSLVSLVLPLLIVAARLSDSL